MGDIKEWSFGFKELKFFLFKKKICKIYGRKMKRVTVEKYIGEKKFRSPVESLCFGDAYEVKIFYYCSNCNRKYSLEELVEGN